jgi:Domain of unknown function (DUF4268)
MYLSTGTSRTKTVVTAPTAIGGIAVKLALGSSAEANNIFRELYAERESIEAELGFAVDWGTRGTGQSPTRIYRQRARGVGTRTDWPEAFDWILDTATGSRPQAGSQAEDSATPHAEHMRLTAAQNATASQPLDRRRLPKHQRSPERDTREAEVLVADAKALEAVEFLSSWSRWVSLAEAIKTAPREPGVYLARRGADGPHIYVGMAGERAGSGRAQGIRGRLAVYASGKGLVSGLGEAAFDRALADPDWLAKRKIELERGLAPRAKDWDRQAVLRADIHVRWAICTDREAARTLEEQCLRVLRGFDLWNRQR